MKRVLVLFLCLFLIKSCHGSNCFEFKVPYEKIRLSSMKGSRELWAVRKDSITIILYVVSLEENGGESRFQYQIYFSNPPLPDVNIYLRNFKGFFIEESGMVSIVVSKKDRHQFLKDIMSTIKHTLLDIKNIVPYLAQSIDVITPEQIQKAAQMIVENFSIADCPPGWGG